MQVKIGVLRSTREIVLETDASPEEIESQIARALDEGSILRLKDNRDGTVLVPVANLAYVELGAPKRGSVGFATL